MTIDAIIQRMYAAMCFSAGKEPDWATQPEVFASSARVVRISDDGVHEFNPVTFRDDYRAMIAAGVLSSFWEGEIWRESDVYGDFAHVLSAYEMRNSGWRHSLPRNQEHSAFSTRRTMVD